MLRGHTPNLSSPNDFIVRMLNVNRFPLEIKFQLVIRNPPSGLNTSSVENNSVNTDNSDLSICTVLRQLIVIVHINGEAKARSNFKFDIGALSLSL